MTNLIIFILNHPLQSWGLLYIMSLRHYVNHPRPSWDVEPCLVFLFLGLLGGVLIISLATAVSPVSSVFPWHPMHPMHPWQIVQQTVNPVFRDVSCFNLPFQGPCKSPTIRQRRQRFSPCPPDNTKARLRIPSPGKHAGWCQ